MTKTVPVKTIALIAHDNKKPDMMEWAKYNKKTLSSHRLIATGTTGKLIESVLDYPVEKLASGPWGGDQQIGAKIAEGEIDLIIFFWDPLEPQPHDPDVKALLRLAVAWNIPTACNRSTADFIISSPLLTSSTYEPQQPDFDAHNNRDVPGTAPESVAAADVLADVIEAIETKFRPVINTAVLDQAVEKASSQTDGDKHKKD